MQLYNLYESIRGFVRPSVRPSVPIVLKLSKIGEIWSNTGCTLYIVHCIGASSVHSFAHLSVSQLVHPLVLSLVLPPDGCVVVCLSDLFLNHWQTRISRVLGVITLRIFCSSFDANRFHEMSTLSFSRRTTEGLKSALLWWSLERNWNVMT